MPNDVDTAAASPSLATPSPIDLTSFSREERQAWRDTGKLPGEAVEKKTLSSEDSATSDTAKEPTSAVKKTETAADPETAKNQEQKPRGSKASAQERLEEVLADLKRAGLSPAELKSFKREQQAKLETKESPQAVPEKTVQPAKLEAPTKPVRPDQNDPKFKTWDDYEKAERQFLIEQDKYVDDIADYKARKAVEEDRAARAQEESLKALDAELVEVRKRYPDFEAKAIPALKKFADDPEVPDFIKGTLMSGDNRHDLLYTLANDSELWNKIVEASKNPMTARKALKAIFAAEDAIAAELDKAKAVPEDTARAENGQFVAQNAPEKPATTRQAKPVTEVSGRGTDTEDPERAAARAGLTSETKASWDRRYAERHK